MKARKLRRIVGRERRLLKKIYKKAEKNIARRAQVLLLSISIVPRYKVRDIATICQYSERSIYNIWKRFNQEGLFGLMDKPRPGRPRLITKKRWDTLLETIRERAPCEVANYIQPNWTLKLIRNYLAVEYSIKVSEKSLSRWFYESGWSYHRSKRELLPPGPLEKETKEEVVRLLTRADLSKEVVVFQDESALYLCGFIGGCWFPKGDQKRIQFSGSKKKFWISGGFDPHSGRVYYQTSQKCNTESFKKFLHQLRQQFRGKQINVVVDNASFHRSKTIRAFLQKHTELTLIYLPVRAPKLNPIERFWLFLKKFLSNFVFADLDELYRYFRKIMWHFQEGNLAYGFNLKKLVNQWRKWPVASEVNI